MSLELTLIENTQKITWNFDEIKQELTDSIAKYSNLVVSEINLKDMEKTQREIAWLRVKIGKFKVAVKKDYLKPYEMFELQVNELAKLVETAEKPIRDQIQKYEDKRKELKTAEIKQMFIDISAELGLGEKYSSQLVVADTYLNKGTTMKAIKEDIQTKVCWFLEIQTKEIAEESARVEKVNMAKMMVEFMSKDLITPVTFAEVEGKIEQLNITELRTYIETVVSGRNEREERAKQVTLEQEERKHIQEVARKEKEEQARIAEIDKQSRIAEAHAEQLKHKAEMEQQEEKRREIEILDMERRNLEREMGIPQRDYGHEKIMQSLKDEQEKQPVIKRHNSQFVLYNVTSEQIKNVEFAITNLNIKFALSVKPVVIEEKQEVDY